MAKNLQQSNQSLQDFLDQQEDVQTESFRVTDDSSANWALRKIKQYQEQQREDVALAEAEISKIEEWLEKQKQDAQQSIDYFQSLLAQYAMEQREKDPKFKKLQLPNGKIKFVKQQPKWNYNDDAIIEALKASGYNDLIKVKESPDKANIKKKFIVAGDKVMDPDTGELVDGITVEEREDAFKVEVDD